jgi:aspartate aminotransferase
MLAAFAERRAILYARLIAMPGVTCVKPMGAFYMLPNIARCGMDSATFAERLLEEEGVALVPGVAFGADTNVRLSYACSIQNIEEGMDRMAAFVRRHQGP